MSGRKLAPDKLLFAIVACLTLFGLAMVGSASVFTAVRERAGVSSYLVRQSLFAVAGLAVMLVLMKVDYRRFADRRFVALAFLGSLVLLGLVLFTPPINGAHRWFPVAGFHLQASEIAKIAFVLFLASTLDRKGDTLADLATGVVPTAAACGSCIVLILIEPDTGTAVLLGALLMVYLYLAGTSLRVLLAMAGAGAGALALDILSKDYKRERFLAFLDPSADPLGAAFQINQSLIAFGSGGALGVGLGQGNQKAYYLPSPHSDFIFAVIGEELGLWGTLLLLALFGVFVWRGLRAAARAPDNFGQYLALGLTLMIGLQALFNMGVATVLLPTKGLPLPFISYGGSSLIASLAAAGILLNISQHSN